MTSTELTMLTEVLKMHLEATMKKELAPLQEEMKKVKTLAAGILKEARQAPSSAPQQPAPTFKMLGKANAPVPINENSGANFSSNTPSVYTDPSLSFAAGHMSTATLPDIDVPLPACFR